MKDSEFWHSTLKEILNKLKVYSRFQQNEEDKQGFIDDVI